jgi:hypothetical protein
MKRTSLSAFAAAAAVIGLTAVSSVHAAPFSQVQAAGDKADESSVLSVDLRPYRHCHWRNGYRWCHGPHYDYYDDYGYQPFPFLLPFFWHDGPDFRYYGDRRDYRRRDYGRRDYRGDRRDGRRDGRRRR